MPDTAVEGRQARTKPSIFKYCICSSVICFPCEIVASFSAVGPPESSACFQDEEKRFMTIRPLEEVVYVLLSCGGPKRMLCIPMQCITFPSKGGTTMVSFPSPSSLPRKGRVHGKMSVFFSETCLIQEPRDQCSQMKLYFFPLVSLHYSSFFSSPLYTTCF